MNLQDSFLNQARKDNVALTIYLVSGVQLKGTVRSFDSFTLLLESPGKTAQLVYKHAIASIVPYRSLVLHGRNGENSEETSEMSAEEMVEAQE